MRCGRVRKNLIDYLEGDLDSGLRSGIEGHLSRCPDCRTELDLLSGALDELKGIEISDPGKAFWENLREKTYRRYRESRALRTTERMPFFERLGIRPIPALAWATAGALFFVAVTFLANTILREPAVTIADLEEDAIIETARETDDLDTYLDALPDDELDALASLTIDVDTQEGTVGDLLAEDYDISRSNRTELALLDGLEAEELASLFEILKERYPAPQDRGAMERSSQAEISRKA